MTSHWVAPQQNTSAHNSAIQNIISIGCVTRCAAFICSVVLYYVTPCWGMRGRTMSVHATCCGDKANRVESSRCTPNHGASRYTKHKQNPTRVEAEGLIDGGIYMFQVRVGDGARWSAWSMTSNAYAYRVPPPTPAPITAAARKGNPVAVEVVSSTVARVRWCDFRPAPGLTMLEYEVRATPHAGAEGADPGPRLRFDVSLRGAPRGQLRRSLLGAPEHGSSEVSLRSGRSGLGLGRSLALY